MTRSTASFMASDIFADTSGFYALLVKGDNRHKVASQVLRDAQRRKHRFVTSDYVLDETATLLKVRGRKQLLSGFFDAISASGACRVEWTDNDRFDRVRGFFL